MHKADVEPPQPEKKTCQARNVQVTQGGFYLRNWGAALRWASLLALICAVSSGCARRPRAARPPVRVGWTQTGIASWYGYPYHGRCTASGEVYDMHGFTAAHRTLPFDTWVRVKNLRNGLQTEVRINDRGPFVRGRIIDLSRAAAEAIDMIGPGTARVRLRVIRPPAQPTLREAYGVQIGAFADTRNARQLAERLSKRHRSVRLIPREADQVLWRVVVGEEPTMEAAAALARELSRQFPDAFVVRLDSPVVDRRRSASCASQTTSEEVLNSAGSW